MFVLVFLFCVCVRVCVCVCARARTCVCVNSGAWGMRGGGQVMPSGRVDVNGQQLDLRRENSWILKMDQV